MTSKTIEYAGHTFLLNDSNGCYIEVALGEQVGYVGVNFEHGTQDNPYCWSLNGDAVAKNIISDGISSGPTIEENIQALFDCLIKSEYYKKFDPETACNSLHKYVDALGESSTWEYIIPSGSLPVSAKEMTATISLKR